MTIEASHHHTVSSTRPRSFRRDPSPLATQSTILKDVFSPCKSYVSRNWSGVQTPFHPPSVYFGPGNPQTYTEKSYYPMFPTTEGLKVTPTDQKEKVQTGTLKR